MWQSLYRPDSVPETWTSMSQMDQRFVLNIENSGKFKQWRKKLITQEPKMFRRSVCIQAHVIQLLDDVLHNMINYRGLTVLVCAINDQ